MYKNFKGGNKSVINNIITSLKKKKNNIITRPLC